MTTPKYLRLWIILKTVGDINMGTKREHVQLPIPGRLYYHYKGGMYEFLNVAKHSETGEDLAVYRSVHYGTFYVRPLGMWFDDVEDHKGESVVRFTLV
jgi:hypothetical protein